MIHSLKAEFRKLFTVRSTYVLIGISFALIILFAFYFEGYKGNTGSPAATLTTKAYLEIVTNGVGLGIIFASIVAILFTGHEYRYSTIMYTLTSNARRTKALAAKLVAICVFCAGYGVLAILIALGAYTVGLSLRDATLPAQDFNLFTELGRVAFYCVGYALIGTLIALVTKSLVVAIAALLIIPTTIEPLLSLVLKENAKYLPFTAIDSTIGAAVMSQNALSPGKAMALTGVYLGIGLAITWVLFVRRDAN